MSKGKKLALIERAIAGQGTAVDVGGALAPILNALVGVEVEDIENIDAKILDELECGDKVIKVTGNDKHAYFVTYKAEVGGGICLSYFDATTVETVSYDRTESGWAYNSTDKGSIPPAQ